MKKKKEYIVAKSKYWSRDKNGYKTRKWFSKKFEKRSIKCYFNWHHKLLHTSPASISLLFFLAERMDVVTNEIRHDTKTIRDYQEFVVKVGNTSYSVAAVRKSFLQLKEQAMIISTPRRGLYRVNPRFLYLGSEEDRRACLSTLMDFSQQEEWVNTNIFIALGYGEESAGEKNGSDEFTVVESFDLDDMTPTSLNDILKKV